MNYLGFCRNFAHTNGPRCPTKQKKKMMNEWKELTLATCQVARQAGHYLRDERRRFRPERIEEKHAHDFVSYVDREAERYVVEGLRRLRPDAGFLTEEGTAAYDGQAACWIIDPLDGTTNFIHDLPPFAVSIAFAVDGAVKIGVVYEACRDECFYAWRDGGAWLDGQPIHVDNASPLGRTLVGVELPYEATAYAPTGHRIIDRFYGLAAGLRMNGSAATSLAYVAAGRFGAWAERFIKPWDFAAGWLLVEEAGGVASGFDGTPVRLDGDGIAAAATPTLHGALLEALIQH